MGAHLISVRKVAADSLAQQCCKEDSDKKKDSRLKKLCKLVNPKSRKCVYEIMKTVDQSKIPKKERFRWIRRVKFILNEISGVYVYDSAREHGKEDVKNNNFQDILDFLDEEGRGDGEKLTSCTSLRSIQVYLKFKSNITGNSSISLDEDDWDVHDNSRSFDATEENVELLLTTYFEKDEL